MPAPTAIHYFGDTSLEIGEEPRIVRRLDGFDEGQFTFHGGGQNSLEPGDLVPGYSNLFVAENTTTNHSGDYEHQIRAMGLSSGTSRRISRVATDTEDGFDTGTETWIVRKGANLGLGRSHMDHPQLYAVSRAERNSPIDQFVIIELGFLGIKTGAKPDRYKTTTSSRELSFSAKTVNGKAGKWNVLRGDPVMVRSYLSLQSPNHNRVARFGPTPAFFPNVSSLSATLNDEDEPVYQWPDGVVLASLDTDQVPGKNVWFVTETYVQRDRITV
jgi:hypothetical protein